MSVTTTAHINFRGDARKALEFYQSVFGGDISIATLLARRSRASLQRPPSPRSALRPSPAHA
jgi:uncharacterized glyoxalase superfamily protein PhnB